MEHEGVPMTWITHRVRVELRDLLMRVELHEPESSSRDTKALGSFEEHTGRLRNVNGWA